MAGFVAFLQLFTCGYAGIVIVSFIFFFFFRTNVTNSLYKAYEKGKPC